MEWTPDPVPGDPGEPEVPVEEPEGGEDPPPEEAAG